MFRSSGAVPKEIPIQMMCKGTRILSSFLALAGSVFVFSAATSAAVIPAAAQSRFALGLAFDFASGDYGTGITSDTATTSLIVGHYPTDRLDIELTIPYLYQTGSSTTSGGIRFGVPRGEEVTMGPPQFGSDARETEDSRQGLGDLLLSVGYILLPESAATPQVRTTAFVKFPTADETEGLGTGEYDFGGGVTLAKWIDRVYLFGGATAVFPGEGAGLGLKDFQTYEAGAGRLIGEKLLPSVSLWGATAPSAESSSLLEARAKLSYQLSASTGLLGYLAAGLADNSPDYAAGGSLFFNF